MVKFYLFILFYALNLGLGAQVVLDSTVAPVAGDSWRVGLIQASTADLTLPVAGTSGVAYDITALGKIVPEGEAVAIEDRSISDLVPFEIADLPMAGDIGNDETLPALPDDTRVALNTYGTLIFGFEDLVTQPEFLTLRDSGLYNIGTSNFEEEKYSNFLIDTLGAGLILPTGMKLGDKILHRSRSIVRDEALGSNDTTDVKRSFEYVSSGSLNTFFGMYEDVAVYLIIDTTNTLSVGFDGNLASEFTSFISSYAFYRRGSYLPLINILFDSEQDDQGDLVDDDLVVLYNIPQRLSPVRAVQSLEFAVYPNPARSRVYIDVPSSLETTVVSLYDITGRLVVSKKMNGNGAVLNTVPIDLPASLASGTYLLRVVSGSQLGSRLINVN